MSCEKFITSCMAVRTAAHLQHLSSKSYAQHVALGDFYEALTDLTDKYAEVYMGANGQATTWPRCSIPTDPPIQLLEEFLVELKAEQQEDLDSQALLNILAEMEELTCQTLYKLRFLK